MGLKFKPGQAVKQVVPVIVGVITDAVIVDGEVQFCVSWTDSAGEEQSKYFGEDQIEGVQP